MTSSERILVLGSGYGGGNWPPLAAITVALHQAGHRVQCFGDDLIAKDFASAGLPLEVTTAGVPLTRFMAEWRAKGAADPAPFQPWAHACLPIVRTIVGDFRPRLIVSEIFTADLARLTKASCRVPWCCINPGFYFGPDALRSYDADYVGPSAGFWHQFDHAITDADLVLHGTSELFDPPPSSLPRHHHYVGALWWEPNPEASAYLATAGPPWVLVTVSSAPQAEEMTLAQSALQALAEQPVRTLLTLSATHRTDEIGPLPANARIGRFVSHAAVLAHSCLLLSHAGHGVVSKALYYGVPMVLVPWGRDQPGVAARASALGVAEVVTRRDFTTTNLIAAIRKVLGCSRYRENAMRVAARLQAHDAIATARARIEQLLNTPLIYGAQPRRSQADG